MIVKEELAKLSWREKEKSRNWQVKRERQTEK